MAGTLVAGGLVVFAARSIWSPTQRSSGAHTLGGDSEPIVSTTNTAADYEQFRATIAAVREGGMRDVDKMNRLFDLSESYAPVAVGETPSDGSGVHHIMATQSLAIVGKSWVMHGSIPEIRERALANAMRWSIDEDPALRANCATLLQAVSASDGPDSLTTEQWQTLGDLLADPEAKMVMDAQLQAWRGSGS